jgi:catechol 2,3-dioxygenase-like lactoylglutathione lyase family enzyme
MKKDKRPGIWIGHIFRKVKDVRKATDFYTKLDMRPLWKGAGMAILELRGGTHLLLFKDSPKNKWVTQQGFDLMVEDVRAFHVRLKKGKLKVSPLKKDRYHLCFYVTDPDGERILVSSDHTDERPV